MPTAEQAYAKHWSQTTTYHVAGVVITVEQHWTAIGGPEHLHMRPEHWPTQMRGHTEAEGCADGMAEALELDKSTFQLSMFTPRLDGAAQLVESDVYRDIDGTPFFNHRFVVTGPLRIDGKDVTPS